MKRKYILCVLCLILLMFNGCGRQQNYMAYIGAEKAKQLALTDSDLTAAGVENITINLATRNGLDYYQVNFTVEGQSYQYSIDALTGAIIEANYSDIVPEGSTVTDADTYNTDKPEQAIPKNRQSQSNSTTENNVNMATEQLTADEAEDKALTHAGLTSDQVTFIKNKLDYDNGCQVYEIEFHTQDYKEYDYEIDAYTGEIISFDYDAERYTSQTSSNSINAITEEDAKELALTQVPGATVDDIQKFKTDYDDGRMEYDGKIVYDGMKYEFEIDGYSGAIRSWEAEIIDR